MKALKLIWNFIYFIYDVFIPHFVTEDVAMRKNFDGTYDPVVAMAHLVPGERYDAVSSVTSFTWLSIGFFGVRKEDDLRPWP